MALERVARWFGGWLRERFQRSGSTMLAKRRRAVRSGESAVQHAHFSPAVVPFRPLSGRPMRHRMTTASI